MRCTRVGGGRRSTPHPPLVTVLFVLVVVSCAGGPEAVRGAPEPELARSGEDATAPTGATRTVFDWNLAEGEARFRGEGVARVAEPYRARLDLFGPRGESYVRAVLIDRDLELPPGIADAPLPPPGLLWSVLGVFREPAGAQLQASEARADTTHLLYTRGSERWSFRLVADLLRFAEWRAEDNQRRTVDVREVGASGRPAEVVYRDWTAFRELTVSVKHVEEVGSFPAETWNIDVR